MELGNMMFGNSRGQFPIERDGWEEELERLFEAYADGEVNYYGEEYENSVFLVMPYWWGDCTCGAGYDCPEHDSECKLLAPNFLYKETGFAIQWYKYPLRDSYMNQDITLGEFREIVAKCVESVEESGDETS